MNSDSSQKRKIFILLSAIVLFFALVGIVVNKFSISNEKKQSNSIIKDQIEEFESTCKYAQLEVPNKLSSTELNEIISLFEEDYALLIDRNTVSLSLFNKYIYSISFELIQKTDVNPLLGFIWKQDGKWESVGIGSSSPQSDIEPIKTSICTECGNC